MENKPPKISVVMLNYNGLNYLKKTMPPILKLDYPNYEFIIVDNGSTDGSKEFIKKFRKIRLIENHKNLGYSKGKNIGVKHAKGDYVLLLDNDILIKNSGIITHLLKKYSKKTGFIYVPVLDYKQKKTGYYGIYYSIYGTNYNLPFTPLKKIFSLTKKTLIGAPDGKNMFFIKSVWNKIKGFDENQVFNLDDMDIGPRAYLLGFENILCSQDYFIHLGVKHQDSLKYDTNRFKSLFSGHARSMIKNYKLKNLILRFPLLCLYQFIKSIKYSIKRKSLLVLFSFLYSGGLFLKNLPDTLKQRKITQSKRVIKEDIFLMIKPPKFD